MAHPGLEAARTLALESWPFKGIAGGRVVVLGPESLRVDDSERDNFLIDINWLGWQGWAECGLTLLRFASKTLVAWSRVCLAVRR